MDKIIPLTILFFLLVFEKSFAQNLTNSENKDSTEHYLLDFSVPDMPAFKALGTNPSDIMRPSDIQKFGAQVSPFFSGGTAIIPQNFALECAPWKLASKRWTLEKYNKPINTFLYNSGFSIGTLRDTSLYNSKLSLGYRFTLISKDGDILKSAKTKQKIYSKMTEYQTALLNLRTSWVTKVKKKYGAEAIEYRETHKKEFVKFLADDIEKESEKDSTLKEQYQVFLNLLKRDNLKKSDFAKDSILSLDGLNKQLDDLILKFKAEKWNASRTDFALAFVGASSDSLISNAQFSSLNLWITQSIAVHKGGQLLIGTNCKLPRTENMNDSVPRRLDLTGNLRYYIGTCDVRGFLEAQYKYRNIDKFNQSLLINIGAEFRLGEVFWIIANAGINNYLGESKPTNKLVSSINIRYAFNKPNK
ncbi:MAG: hypothetical protein Q8T03_02745 [Bacteroidota bacterium]|nr:hypothetical protein [Bacteroidota bacterium]